MARDCITFDRLDAKLSPSPRDNQNTAVVALSGPVAAMVAGRVNGCCRTEERLPRIVPLPNRPRSQLEARNNACGVILAIGPASPVEACRMSWLKYLYALGVPARLRSRYTLAKRLGVDRWMT